MDVCWLGAGQQWRHGCVLVGCWPAMETWVCAGSVLIHNGGMGMCWLGAGQQWEHGYVSADLKVIIWEIPFRSAQRLAASLAHIWRKRKTIGRKVCARCQPASHPASLVFPHFWSPGFVQAPRKVRRKVYGFFNTTTPCRRCGAVPNSRKGG